MSKFALALLLAACASTPKQAPVCPTCPEPPPPPVAAQQPEAPPAQSEPDPDAPPPNVEYSVTAEKNLEKGRAALAKKDFAAARAYFTFLIGRFPHSSFIHDAELGLAEVEVTERPVIASSDDTAAYCQFIEHHPFHPLVTNGDLACRVNTLQKVPCVAKQTVPVKYCGVSYCKAPDAAKRPECKQ
jgi:hypothetical protein